MFLATAAGVQVLASNADPLPAGSPVALRELFMDGAGRHTMFWARRAGGGMTYWTHNVATGITARVVADGEEAPIDGGGRIVVTSTLNRFVGPAGEVVFPATVRSRSGGFLFSWTPTSGLGKLAGPGDAVLGTTLTLTSCSTAALLSPPFSGDHVVFRGTLSDGSSNGIFLVPKGRRRDRQGRPEHGCGARRGYVHAGHVNHPELPLRQRFGRGGVLGNDERRENGDLHWHGSRPDARQGGGDR